MLPFTTTTLDEVVVGGIVIAALYGLTARRRSVSSITASLEKTVGKLETHTKSMVAKASRHQRKIDIHLGGQALANDEFVRAVAVSENLRALLGKSA